jgi:hypothetical protein
LPAIDNFRVYLESIYHIRPVESSTWTVARLELQVQSLETPLGICPIRLVESSTYTVARLKVLVQVQPLEICILPESKNHSPVSYLCSSFFLSTLRKLTPLFQWRRTFTKSPHYYCSPCYPFLSGAYFLPLLTCRHVALSLVRNQCSRHDFKVHLSALSVSWSVALPHPPLRNVCTYPDVYHVACKITVLFLTKKIHEYN